MGSSASESKCVAGQKRRRQEQAKPSTKLATSVPKQAVSTSSNAKKRRRRNKKLANDEEDLEVEAWLNGAFARMDSQLLADHVAQRTRRFGRDELSSIELSDLYIPATAIKDTSWWKQPRKIEALPSFLEAVVEGVEGAEGFARAPKDKGAPHTLVVTGAGLRAADLVRSLKRFQNESSKVAKLFAKHIKIEESITFLNKTYTNIAVGTPQRLIDLTDHGALSLAHLQRVVVDASHIDQKKRGILDMKETVLPLVRFLTRPDLRCRYGSGDEEGDGAAGKRIELIFY